MSTVCFDTLIIGAGIVGLATAYQLKKSHPKMRILIVEKENTFARHQTGHNSGVIHSGIYYKPGSLKAKNCKDGYAELLNFARKYNIPFDICGKIIVATSNAELAGLDNIYERGIQNGLIGLKKLSRSELKNFEPHCNGIAAVHVPQTGIIDYLDVARVLYEILVNELEVEIVFNAEVLNIRNSNTSITVFTSKGEYLTRNLISCAGLFSDRITNITESANDLRIIPFRGEYYTIKPEKEALVNNLIYPVPNPNFPFLGVHFTRMIKGGIEAGPNAVLAFKREGYKFTDLSLRDLTQTLVWPGFWKVVGKYGKTGIGEIYRSLSKSAFTKELQKLLPDIKEDDLVPGGAGVRAQACNREGLLIDDFNIVKNGNIIHVRNAPSPAATSCFAIGQSISELINYKL